MKLALTLEADSINVQALNMGRIVVDIDGVNLAELINVAATMATPFVLLMNLTGPQQTARHHLLP
ncbi:aec77 [Escherichia coli]|uniref:Aec77 n=1 Tax=Escherichia coli TaxID=562 RepID=A0A376KI56_ECOLX|nr:aec77 [Escherichia coli]